MNTGLNQIFEMCWLEWYKWNTTSNFINEKLVPDWACWCLGIVEFIFYKHRGMFMFVCFFVHVCVVNVCFLIVHVCFFVHVCVVHVYLFMFVMFIFVYFKILTYYLLLFIHSLCLFINVCLSFFHLCLFVSLSFMFVLFFYRFDNMQLVDWLWPQMKICLIIYFNLYR